MSKREDISKLLIIGSGPAIIGQSSELDYAGTQACKALKELGYKIIVVNSNPASIMSGTSNADATYIMPINVRSIDKIIAKEKPDAIICAFGGQTAVNICVELNKMGILQKNNIQLIGITLDTIVKSKDGTAFKNTMAKLNVDILKSEIANSADEAVYIADRIGYPVVIRPEFKMSGEGGGLAYNIEELRLIASKGISVSSTKQIKVEEAALGWQELELEILRDANKNKITVCGIENIDAMGINSGDSICCIPMQTVQNNIQFRIQTAAYKIADELNIIGSANIQFAYDIKSDRLVVIEINPISTSSTTLASKATGMPVAKLSAMLSVGITLDELKDNKGETLDKYKHIVSNVTVKLPRFDFDKLKGSIDSLDIQMKAVGEGIGIGKTYKEALNKALISIDNSILGFGSYNEYSEKPLDELLVILQQATSKRHFIMFEALRKGATSEQICKITKINNYFVTQFKELAEIEEEILAYKGGKLPDKLLIQAKKDGFADKYIAILINSNESIIRKQRESINLIPSFQVIKAIEQEKKEYYYSSYNTEVSNEEKINNNQKIIIIGSGVSKIGQGSEFDSSCVYAAEAFKKLGFETIIVNCASNRVSTDYSVSDKLYIEPLTVESVLAIYNLEKPVGVISQFGGESAVQLTKELKNVGIKVLDEYATAFTLADKYESLVKIANKFNIPITKAAKAESITNAIDAAVEVGYPVIVSAAINYSNETKIIHTQQQLNSFLINANINLESPVIISKFLSHSTEAEVDVLSYGEDVFIPAISEHIELAGIHSGDSASVLPSVNILEEHKSTITKYSAIIANELNACGLINLQFSIADNKVYFKEANLYASRTVSLVSNVCNIKMAEIAAKLIAANITGNKFDIKSIKPLKIAHFGVKEAVFPFSMFPEVDPALSPEMRSTGEVLGIADSFGLAFFRAQEATQTQIPLSGKVLISVNNDDKHEALIAARAFSQMGFEILATLGTHQWLKQNGVSSTYVYKLNEGRPNILDEIINGKIDIIINTPASTQGLYDDSYIRKAAIKNKVFYMTTMAAAIAAVKGINAIRGTTHFIAKSLQEYHSEIIVKD